nr:hypothetical protein [Tanacetum cinerariifolium]
MSWREFILALGLHTEEEMESLSFARDPMVRLYNRMMAHSVGGRNQAPKKEEKQGSYLWRTVCSSISQALWTPGRGEALGVDCDTLGPERQPDAAAGALGAAEDAFVVNEVMALPPRDHRHEYLRMLMEHHDDGGVMVFTSRAWGRMFETKGPLLGGARRRMSWREFILALGLHTEEEMESLSFARDPMVRLYNRMMAHSVGGRNQAPKKEEKQGSYLWRTVCSSISQALWTPGRGEALGVDCDTLGPERQPDAAAGALGAAEDAFVVNEGDQAI